MDEWFMVLDLKDDFYRIIPAKESQYLFAVEWGSSQLTWIVLIQGHKNLTTLFSQVLKRDLEWWAVWSYVDDLFLSTTTKEECLAATVSLLNCLADAGYQVAREKA